MLRSIRVRLFVTFVALIVFTVVAIGLTLDWQGAGPPWHLLAMVGCGVAVAAFVMTTPLTRAVLYSVEEVRAVAGHMAAGNLKMRVPAEGSDELAQLGQTINRLADEIQRNLDGVIEEKNKLDAILSSLVDGVVTVSNDGTITFFNQMATRIFNDAARTREAVKDVAGLEDPQATAELPPPTAEEPAGILGRKLADLLDTPRVQDLLESCLSSGTAISREMSLGDRAFVVFAIPLGEAGQKAEALMLLRDVTSLRQLETARSQFLGNVSHELKTPLTIIKGFVITLLKSPGIIDEWKRYLEFIDREADRLARLVDDLLNLARLRSKRTQMNFTFCEPVELLKDAFRQLQAQAAKYDSVLALDCPPTLPVLLADPDRFKEIVINLVDNAFKYTPPKGRVELAAQATHEYLHVRVSDHGPGIAKEEVPFLFERFFRGTDKADASPEAPGIGLAIVKEIVDQHRGNITVSSATGEGTTFDVALPLRQKGRRAEVAVDPANLPLPGATLPSPPVRP